MSEPFEDRLFPAVEYYKPPSRIHLRRTCIALVVAAIGAAVGAAIYAHVLPEIFDLHFRAVAVGLAAIGTGVLSGVTVKYGKIEGRIVGGMVGSFLGSVVIYTMWMVWVYDVLQHFGASASLRKMFVRPQAVLHLIWIINQDGTWSFQRDVVRGPALLILWLGEAALFMGAAVAVGFKSAGLDEIICNRCGKVCKSVSKLPRFKAACEKELLAAIKRRDFLSLRSFARIDNENDPELTLRLASCPGCEKMHVLTVNRIAWQPDAHMGAKVNVVPLVNQLLVTREEAGRIMKLKEPSPEPTDGERIG